MSSFNTGGSGKGPFRDVVEYFFFFFVLLLKVADALLVQHSAFLKQIPGCLLCHLWLQSAQNFIMVRGEGYKEQKCIGV